MHAAPPQQLASIHSGLGERSLGEQRHHIDGGALVATHHHVQVLDGLPRGTLAHVVNDRHDDHTARNAVLKHADEVEVGPSHMSGVGDLSLA